MRNIILILFLLVASLYSNQVSAQVVILKTDTVEVDCNSSAAFLVPLRASDFEDVGGLQFTFQWDAAALNYEYITEINPAFQGVGFDTTQFINDGKFTFSWTSLSGVTLPDDAVLLKVGFTRIGGPASVVTFTDIPTSIAVFNDSFGELSYEVFPGLVKPIDNQVPVITCPANLSVEAVGSVAIPGIAPVGSSDNCSITGIGWSSTGTTIADFPNDPDASSAVFNQGNSTVVYTATDVAGNTATCSFLVSVEFAVGSDLTLIPVIPTAACGEMITVDITAFNFDSIAGLQYSLNWDPNALQYQSVTNLNPILNQNLSNFNETQVASGQFSYSWTSASLTGNTLIDGAITYSIKFMVLGEDSLRFNDIPTFRVAFSGTTFPPEEVPVVTVNAIVSVVDTVAPSITCPADVTVQAPASVAVNNISPNAQDNCSGLDIGWESVGQTTTNQPNDPDASGAIFNQGTSTVTYTSTDAGGNTATCSFLVTVEFGIATEDLTLVASSPSPSCGESFFIDISVLNFDSIAGVQFSLNWDPAVIQYDNFSNLNPVLNQAAANFNETQTASGVLSYAWTSATLVGNSLMDGENMFRLNFTVIGSGGTGVTFGDIPTFRTAFSGTAFPPFEVPMQTFDGQVNVQDNTDPVITCPANVTIDLPIGNINANLNNLQPVSLSDNCPGVIALTYAQTGATTGSGTGNANGVYNAGQTVVTYHAEDLAGNETTCSFLVNVVAVNTITYSLDTINADCTGGDVEFCIKVDNFTDIIGTQFNMTWDTSALEFDTIANAYAGLNLNSSMFFNYQTVQNGLLVFFGGSQTWPDIPDSSVFFCIKFKIKDTNGSSSLHFQGPFDAVNTAFQQVPVLTSDGYFTATADNVPPTVTCPTNVTLTLPAGSGCAVQFMPLLPNATDACGTIDTITRTPSGNAFVPGITIITYTVSDEAGNTSTCTFLLTVRDTVAPLVSNCPSNITVDAPSGSCQATATWVAPSFVDCSSLNQSNNFNPGDLFPANCMPTMVMYKAVDFFGNTAQCQFNVLVRDVTAPSITCPADIVLFPQNNCDTMVTFTMPTATDLCDQDLDIACDLNSGDVVAAGTIMVTCIALDDCNNIGQCTFNVTVVDAAAPTISNCPADITVESNSNNCGLNVSWTEPTSTDVCDPLVALIASPHQPGDFFVVGPPQTVTYTATDDSGNFSTCAFTVTVLDVTPPTLIDCPTLPLLILLPNSDCDTVLTWVEPTGFDNCTQFTLSSNFSPGHNFTTGDTLVTYIITDGSGNKDSCSFNIVVRDQVPPVLSNCPDDITVNANGDCKVAVTWLEPTASDNCSIPKVEAPFDPGDEFMVGTTLVQIIAQDASNNFDTCNFSVTVVGVPPGFDLNSLPANVTLNACDTLYDWPLPTPTGFCNPVTVSSDPVAPFLFNPGMHTVIFTATDGSATVTASFVVTVEENIAPVFTCPTSAIDVNTGGVVLSGSGFITSADTVAGCNEVELFFEFPAATDNCSAAPDVTQTDGSLTGESFPIGTHSLTFEATDASGNTSICSVTINVLPLEALNPMADPNPGCLNETVVLTATDIQGAAYVWTKLPGTVLGSTGSQHTIQSLTSQQAGVYTVAANVNGCLTPLDSVEVVLLLAVMPVNDVFTSSVGDLDTFNVFLNDGITDPSSYEICTLTPDPLPAGVNYLGNGLFAFQETTGENVSFTYQICYCDQSGEVATVTIMVQDDSCSFIPNIITPNDDGLNDWFTIPCLNGRNFSENSLVIYNQWGDKVFEDTGYTNDPTDATHPAWKGTLNNKEGKDLPDGVYYYIFKPSPNDPAIKGFVEIFR